MINKEFYAKRNLIFQFLGGKVGHFSIKDATVTLEWYEYILKAGETLPIVASRIFGNNLEYLWPYIADNNPPRHPDDWAMGETIKLPKLIVRDSDILKNRYSNATTDTTAI